MNHSVCTYKTKNSQIDESRAGVETRVFIGSKSGLTNTLARKLGANVEMDLERCTDSYGRIVKSYGRIVIKLRILWTDSFGTDELFGF